jgi:hypothetical protein
VRPNNELMPIADAAARIRQGKYLGIAGDESALARLPRGHWIGGTIPYFMSDAGGCMSRDRVFVTEIPAHGEPPRLRFCDLDALPMICHNAPDNGFTLLILPAFSQVHERFAHDAPNYEDMYLKPLVGWIAGVHLDDLGKCTPKVFLGESGEMSDRMAVVMDVPLPPEKMARIDIVNLFRQGDGDAITFTEAGFSADRCLINGQPAILADYLAARHIDTRLPLVADYCGAMINVSFKAVVPSEQRVDFYAPVFPGQVYRIAAPVDDYVTAFQAAIPSGIDGLTFSCNCILNYLYSNLEGRRTEGVTGPITFGEIAYQLLNQTLVYLSIEG